MGSFLSHLKNAFSSQPVCNVPGSSTFAAGASKPPFPCKPTEQGTATLPVMPNALHRAQPGHAKPELTPPAHQQSPSSSDLQSCKSPQHPSPVASVDIKAGFVSQQLSLVQGVQLFQVIKPFVLNQLISIQSDPKHP